MEFLVQLKLTLHVVQAQKELTFPVTVQLICFQCISVSGLAGSVLAAEQQLQGKSDEILCATSSTGVNQGKPTDFGGITTYS